MTASPWVTASLYIINDNSRVCTIDVMTRHIVQYMLWIRTRLQRVYTDFITPKLPPPLQAISLPKHKCKKLIKTLEGETSYQIKPKFIWSIKRHQSTPSFGYTPGIIVSRVFIHPFMIKFTITDYDLWPTSKWFIQLHTNKRDWDYKRNCGFLNVISWRIIKKHTLLISGIIFSSL